LLRIREEAGDELADDIAAIRSGRANIIDRRNTLRGSLRGSLRERRADTMPGDELLDAAKSQRHRRHGSRCQPDVVDGAIAERDESGDAGDRDG
jgi:hypothetical protein